MTILYVHHEQKPVYKCHPEDRKIDERLFSFYKAHYILLYHQSVSHDLKCIKKSTFVCKVLNAFISDLIYALYHLFNRILKGCPLTCRHDHLVKMSIKPSTFNIIISNVQCKVYLNQKDNLILRLYAS